MTTMFRRGGLLLPMMLLVLAAPACAATGRATTTAAPPAGAAAPDTTAVAAPNPAGAAPAPVVATPNPAGAAPAPVAATPTTAVVPAAPVAVAPDTPAAAAPATVPMEAVAPAPADTVAAVNWRVPAAKDGLYFKLSSFVAQDYLALLKNGTYLLVTQSDLSAWVTDSGTWQFTAADGGVLTSAGQTEVDYRDIDAGAFTVTVRNRNDYQQLPDIRWNLSQFMQSSSSREFSFAENPGLARELHLNPITNRFTRANLQRAIDGIDTALASARPLTMPFRICGDSDYAYIISGDMVERNLLLMHAVRARERLQRYGHGHHVPARITGEEFAAVRRTLAAATAP
ncbi:MAG TPA: hypothetical protein PKM88_03240 [bacterium]|nr:hypothetical protein [bacterium]